MPATSRFSFFNRDLDSSKYCSAALLTMGLTALSSLLLQTPPAQALEEVELAYAGFKFGSLSVQDLESFAETGQPSRNLEAIMRLAKVEQADVLRVLNTDVSIDSELLNEASYTFIGESFFQLIGSTIKLPISSEQSWVYLREALLTAGEDDEVNVIEVLKSFPTDSVVVETDKVGQVIKQVEEDASIVEEFLDSGFLNVPQ